MTVSVRYVVNDVDEAITFYTERLGFELVMHPAPPFAILDRAELRLLLSAPNAGPGGGQSLPDGRQPQPGGWNRISLEVDDLAGEVDRLVVAGVPMRSDVIHGVGGDQVICDDPSGNPVELFQPKE